MDKIIGYIIDTIPYMCVSLPFILLYRIIRNILNKSQKLNILRECAIILFCLYCVALASQTIIPKLEFNGSGTIGIVNGNLDGEINLIPGKVIYETYIECVINSYYLYFWINMVGNICLFIPIGYFINALWEVSVKKTILIALLSSSIIEIVQLFLHRGTDIDDLWINLLGALVGLIIYKATKKNKYMNLLYSKIKS